MKIASEQELHLDMSAVNPSALLVSAANGCCAGICAYNSDSFSAPALHDDQEAFSFWKAAERRSLQESSIRCTRECRLSFRPKHCTASAVSGQNTSRCSGSTRCHNQSEYAALPGSGIFNKKQKESKS